MSKQHFNLKWREAIDEITEQCAYLENLAYEQNETMSNKNYKRSDFEWFHLHANLYIKYVETYKKLEDCYDQIVHPQKRTLLREMLENTMVRIIEEKIQLVKYNTGPPDKPHQMPRSDFVNLDEIIMDLKLTPDCVDIPIPRYYREEEKRRLDERNFLIDELLLEYHETKEPEIEEFEERPLINEQDEDQARKQALSFFFINELGRQGIEKGYDIKRRIRQNELKRKQQFETQDDSVDQQSKAKTVIRKYWRGTLERFKMQMMREKELLFLGIKIDEDEMDQIQEDPNDIFQFIQKRYLPEDEPRSHKQKMINKRKQMKIEQQVNERESKETLEQLKTLVKDNEGANFKEQMLKERRDWIHTVLKMSEFNDVPTKVQDYYDRLNVLDPEAFDKKVAQQEEEAKKKATKADPKAAAKGKGAKKSELDEFLDQNKPTGPSEAFLKLQKKIQDYDTTWNKNEKDNENFDQKQDIEIAKNNIRPAVEEEIKIIVDEMIDIELQNLRIQLNKKPLKKTKPKKSKNKGRKKKFPGDNNNKGKDIKELLSMLIEKEVVKKLPPALLKDLMGEPNVLGAQNERECLAPALANPSMLQIRQNIAEYIGIPLGSKYAREKIIDCMVREKFDKNNQMNFFLFFGPHGVGKTLAVRALATECNAIIIDISPTNIEGKFQEKNPFPGLINAAFKVAQEYQPAIILCENVEMIFLGKKKKGVVLNTTFSKMKKPLQDFKKGKFFNADDRVAFIATSAHPFDGGVKDMKLFFDKKFLFPYPEYSTRKLLLEHFISQKGIILPPNLSLNSLAHISDGYTAGSLKMAVDKVLTQKRLKELLQPYVIEQLKVKEFIGPLSLAQYNFKGDYKSFQLFTDEIFQFKERRDKLTKEGEEKNDKKNSKKPGKK